MCGIAGYIDSTLKEADRVLERMNSVMFHRGPDEGGVCAEPGWGVAMRRLSVIDVSGGSQPMWNEDRTVCLVYNGEIYNYRELKEDLIKRGIGFRTNSDTEVLLRLYELKNKSCLRDLNGMFAFAIYDRRDKSCFLARDRMGEKPLHYYHDGRRFVFASEIKSILEYPGIDLALSREALNMYLTFEYVPAPFTIYNRIYKVLPGTSLVFKNNEILRDTYWSPSFGDLPAKMTEHDMVEELNRLLMDSVKLRTVSDVPLGSLLSGGIDSSLVTAILASQVTRKVKTFSVAFDEFSFDESACALKVARLLGTDHHVETLTSKRMVSVLPAILNGLDEPFADESLIPTYLLSRHARTAVTVALGGDGGDELFGGYPTYQAHKIARLIPRWLGRPLQIFANLIPASDENISLDFVAKRFASGIKYAMPVRHQIWLGAFEPAQKLALLSDDVRRDLNGRNEFQLIEEAWAKCASARYMDKIYNLDLKYYLQDDILVKVDRASMANSLEVRAPYLDHRLVEFANKLPENMKIRGMQTKFVLKLLGRRYLPQEIVKRKKKGFGVPIAKWFKTDLKFMLYDVLQSESIKKGGLFQPDYIRSLIDEHLSGVKDNRKLLWTLLVFEAWRTNASAAGKITQ